MKDQYADYETSKKLKELGFDELCHCFYEEDETFKFNNGDEYTDGSTAKGNWLANNKTLSDDFYVAPTWQQVKQWLWEKHNIRIETPFSVVTHSYYINILKREGINSEMKFGKTIFYTAENPIAGEIEGIKKAVEYLYKNK